MAKPTLKINLAEKRKNKEQEMSKPAIRAAIREKAKEKKVSVPKSAMDNFVNTYQKTKVGPIQRKIASFLSGMNTKADYTKPTSTTAKMTTTAQANRAKSQGGRSARSVALSQREKRLQADSKRAKQAQADKIAAKEANMNVKKTTPKTWKDVKSVAAAQKAGLNYFMGRDGKKKIAITQEQLKKKGMGLTEYANLLRKKGKK